MDELELAADRLLARVAQDPEYPFRTEQQMKRRRMGRGRASEAFREVAFTMSLESVPAPLEREVMPGVSLRLLLQGAELAPEERCCLLLHTWYELSDVEIADLFGKHRNTMKRWRKRACRKLREAALEMAA
jgi:DNA-directed RNA polymerase specialized sigma24 family protein